MYHSTGVGKLNESQKSKLLNGHPVRIKLGSGNNLHLTDQQIKKLQSAHKKELITQLHSTQNKKKNMVQVCLEIWFQKQKHLLKNTKI